MSEQKKWEDSFTRTMNLEMNSVTARADFLVPVDKSLEPFYSVDDVIMIQSQPDVFEGEQGLFLIDGKPLPENTPKGSSRILTASYPTCSSRHQCCVQGESDRSCCERVDRKRAKADNCVRRR